MSKKKEDKKLTKDQAIKKIQTLKTAQGTDAIPMLTGLAGMISSDRNSKARAGSSQGEVVPRTTTKDMVGSKVWMIGPSGGSPRRRRGEKNDFI